MAWIVLIASGCLEAVWASALAASEGFSKLWPSLLFFVSLGLSMAGLAWAVKSIPIGTGYAVWVGIGATLTVLWAVISGVESLSVAKVIFLAMIVGGVVGLKLAH